MAHEAQKFAGLDLQYYDSSARMVAALARAGGEAPFRLQGRVIAVEAQAV